MNTILFDLGGTLIEDPFEDVLSALYHEYLKANFANMEKDALMDFFSYWRDENLGTDYAFASHFLQEETWPLRALLRLSRTKGVPRHDEIPLLSVTILKRYRELAHRQIESQPQLPMLKNLLTWLKGAGAKIGVASNDREFAARTMLTWADLAEPFDWIFTSEGLSETYPKAEKPAPEFFHAVLREINQSRSEWSQTVYVGDSERNDIIPARSLGIRTVRYLNRRNLQKSSWLDTSTESIADYQCSDRAELPSIFRKILRT